MLVGFPKWQYGSGLLYMLLNTQLLGIQKSLNRLPKLWMLYPVQ
jgi:hypothetical protein